MSWTNLALQRELSGRSWKHSVRYTSAQYHLLHTGSEEASSRFREGLHEEGQDVDHVWCCPIWSICLLKVLWLVQRLGYVAMGTMGSSPDQKAEVGHGAICCFGQ